MMRQNPLLKENQKQSRTRRFIVGYLDLVAKGMVLLIVLGLPLYYVIVRLLGLHTLIFLFAYMFVVFALNKYIQKIKFGDYFLESFEKWERKKKK
jgi:hypothetical protein